MTATNSREPDMPKFLRLFLLIAFTCLPAPNSGGMLGPVPADAATAQKRKIVRLQLAWTHQFEFAGFYAARAKGFYTQEGLDVRIVPGGPGIHPIDQVLSGKAQYGVAGSEVLLNFLRGKPLNVWTQA